MYELSYISQRHNENSVKNHEMTDLPTFLRGGLTFSSAAPHQSPTTNIHYDLISLLSVAQQCKVDFIPITWQPALESLGEGATAQVSQSLINIQTNFAFKRMRSSVASPLCTPDVLQADFKALVSEILVLRNPPLHRIPSILNLEGICWEVKPSGKGVWPVLVSTKAQLGDLQKFMEFENGGGASIHEKIGLCIDVANAIMALHSCSMGLKLI